MRAGALAQFGLLLGQLADEMLQTLEHLGPQFLVVIGSSCPAGVPPPCPCRCSGGFFAQFVLDLAELAPVVRLADIRRVVGAGTSRRGWPS
jgi:hypothetical protein